MLAIILAISLFSSSDTIIVKSTQDIYYRIFAVDSNLYFQHKTNTNWSAPKIIDEKASEYAMITSNDYIHIVWCKDGRIYYKTNLFPLSQKDTIQWECNIAISPYFTEPASNIFISTNRDYLYVTWQSPLESNPSQTEIWRRARWLGNTPFEWEEPQNISLNVMPASGIPHSSNNRDPIQMKRVSFLQSGQYTGSDGNTICCDSDHDGLNELIYRTGSIINPLNPLRWEIQEYQPMNRYEVVFADTGAYPYPPGITTGNFRPHDVGDIDRDSLIDLVGPNVDKPSNPDTVYFIVTTQESPNYTYYPESLSWWYRYSNNFLGNGSAPFYFPIDLDQDNCKELIFLTAGQGITCIFENRGNNLNTLVWRSYQVWAWSFAFNDFDLDSIKEFATADLGSLGKVSVYENTGPDQYMIIYQDTVRIPNGLNVFSGNDVDSDGKPEFFVTFLVVPTSTYYLYMWEATGNNTYERTLVSQISGGGDTGRRSKCGDIDGDGVDEIVWSVCSHVYAYKATGNNQFQQIWWWYNDHSAPCAIVNIYDMNRNGYNEIVISGAGKTSLFEVEAVRILYPNGDETFHVDSTELIQWQKFYPPRCDSLSLFYSTNNGRTYRLIASNIPASDTSYLWTVHNVTSDSCKIKIIAYGPGWQYDESDGVFRIISTGIEEIATLPLAMTLWVEVYPNPAKSMSVVRYTLPVEGKVSLQLYNISGQLVKTLVDENNKPGNYKLTLNTKTLSAGVYFLLLQTQDKRIIERLVIVR